VLIDPPAALPAPEPAASPSPSSEPVDMRARVTPTAHRGTLRSAARRSQGEGTAVTRPSSHIAPRGRGHPTSARSAARAGPGDAHAQRKAAGKPKRQVTQVTHPV
jgi:hypothetical protein